VSLLSLNKTTVDGSSISIEGENKMNTNRMIKIAVVAALYTMLTLVLAPISYGNIQIRLSEALVLLAFFDPFYIGGLTLGCFIANSLGPNGMMDIIWGTFATFLSVGSLSITGHLFKKSTKALYVASLWPTLFNGVIIGLMLHYLFALPLVLTMIQVAVGELIAVSIVGVPLFIFIKKKYPHFLTTHEQSSTN
jgi:uncharacterized membrane protein